MRPDPAIIGTDRLSHAQQQQQCRRRLEKDGKQDGGSPCVRLCTPCARVELNKDDTRPEKDEQTTDTAADGASAIEHSAEPSQDASSAESASPETENKGETAAQDGKGEQAVEGKEEAGEAKHVSTITAPFKPPALPARRAASSIAIPRPPIPARAQPTPPVSVIARSIIPAAGGDDLNWAEKRWQEVVKHTKTTCTARALQCSSRRSSSFLSHSCNAIPLFYRSRWIARRSSLSMRAHSVGRA